jgi:Flp pilus assembly protein TadD
MSYRLHVGRFAWLGLTISFCMPLEVLAVGSGSISPPAAPRGSIAPPAAPRSAEAEYNRGLEAKSARRFAEAVASFRRAVDTRPDFPEAWNELGFALRQTGQFPDALKAYEQALRLRPDFPEALEYLGEAYVEMGRLEDARAILVRLGSLDPVRARELEEAIQAMK